MVSSATGSGLQTPGQQIEPLTVLTVGHSTRPLAEFIALLKAHEIQALADIRTVPRSRHNPQFNRESLAEELPREGIAYLPMPGLGGLRRPRPDSTNTGWRNDSFRGFADYMQTPEFAEGLDGLLATARDARTAVMCAEAVPWRCHRSLIADALSMRGVRVEHILGPSRRQLHEVTPWARVEDSGRITYPMPLDGGMGASS
jgi:uncharacterized protein (DUF488 family)